MKKKFSFVFAIIMIVCTLSIALVSCAPKDEEPFTAPSAENAYNEIWAAWIKANDYTNEDTLGIDLKVDAISSNDKANTNLSIIAQVGLDGKTGSDKEAIRVAIIDNNEQDDIVDITINKDGLYFRVLGMEKPLLFSELNLPALGVGSEGAGNTIDSVKEILIDVVMSLVGTDVKITPVLADKKDKKYDVTYDFGLDFTEIVGLLENPDGLINIISGSLPSEVVDIIKEILPEVKNLLDGLKINFTVKTSGNTQTKVNNPKKTEPKYSYAGGAVTQISATGAKGEYGLNIAIDGLKINKTLPTIEVPSDANVVNASMFKHKITGNVNLKDDSGKNVSSYTYRINLDFAANNILQTIKECITTGSATPILNKMFKDQDGKLFVEIYHDCADTCKVTHAKGQFDGSVIAIAYSPQEFKNNRVYVSFNLGTILPSGFEQEVLGANLTIAPDYYTQFSFDFLQYIELKNMKGKSAKANSIKSVSAVVDGEEETTLDIEAMLDRIITGLKTDQKLQIKIDDIRDILEQLYKDGTLEKDTYETTLKVVNCLFKGVDEIAVDNEYANGVDFEENVLELYNRQNATTPKNFGGTEVNNGQVIKGKPTYDKYDNGNIKLYYSSSNDEVPELSNLIYNENGEMLSVSYETLMSMVDSKAKGSGGKVKYTFTDLFGNQVTTYSKIIEIVGLDKTKFDESQEVTLVLHNGAVGTEGFSAGIGSNLNNLFPILSDYIDAFKDLTTPDLVVKTKITLSAT